MIFFRITEGPQVEIACVRFEGNHSFSKSKLLKVMPKTTEAGFLKDAPFVLEEVQRDVVQLNRFYQSEGFLDAQRDAARLDSVGRLHPGRRSASASRRASPTTCGASGSRG